MAKKDYTVTRSMIGDKPYERGDVRTMDEADAADMLRAGALVPHKPKSVPPAKPDYAKDKLGELALDKASRPQLDAIAAHEKVTVPEGKDATDAQVISAIVAARAK